MYDWPGLTGASDALWSLLAQALREAGLENVPDTLHRKGPPEAVWSHPDMLLSQTCGYPFTHEFHRKLTLAAVPVYDTPGCQGATYSSAIVVRARSGHKALSDLRGRTAAFNSTQSMSGHLALKLVFARLAENGRFFGRTVCSGSHVKSMQMVAGGKADAAAIDAVCYGLAAKHLPQLTARLEVIAWSPRAPALPLVTAPGRPQIQLDMIRTALQNVVKTARFARLREPLLISGFEFPAEQVYDQVLQFENWCAVTGYKDLA